MGGFLTHMAASWRLGRAAKLRRALEYDRAIALLSENRRRLAARPGDLSCLSTRLMSLVRLAELSAQVRRHDLATDALREWVRVWEDACARAPGLAKVAEIEPWERWVRGRLTAAERDD